MLELYAFGALASIGYMLKQRREEERRRVSSSRLSRGADGHISKRRARREIPNGPNVYQGDAVVRAHKGEFDAVRRASEASRNPQNTGVIPRSAAFDSLTGGSREDRASSFGRKAEKRRLMRSPLTGKLMGVEEFTHTNMTPFFGSRTTQDMDHDRAAGTHMSRLNGAVDAESSVGPKKEIAPLFEPSTDVAYVTGQPNQTDFMHSRMVEPKSKNNQMPFQQVRVGPGVKGEDDEEDGASPQDVYLKQREYAKPRSTEEIRRADDPKISYEARTVAGMKGKERGDMGKVEKRLPTTVKERTSTDDFLKTTGAVVGPTARPEKVMVRKTTRPDTHVYYTGAARNAGPDAEGFRSRASGAPLRTGGLSGGNSAPADATRTGRGADFDHGRDSILVYDNNRDVTSKRVHRSNVSGAVKAAVAPLTDAMRMTRKQFTTKNERPEGSSGPNPQMPAKATVRDPDHVARTTLKETTEDAGTRGVSAAAVRGSGAPRGVVYDPDQVARTTIRETTEDAGTRGVSAAAVKGGGAPRGVAYDPEQVARTTVRETTEEARPGAANVRTAAYKPVCYDPESRARTTLKETGLAPAPKANLSSGAHRPVARDPDDVARTTVKETTVAADGKAFASVRNAEMRGDVRDPDHVAKTTVKETTADNTQATRNLRGEVTKPEKRDADLTPGTTTKQLMLHETRGGAAAGVQSMQGTNAGYTVTGVEAPFTSKEVVGKESYVGGAKNAVSEGGHDLAQRNTSVKDTNRQTTGDAEYYGTAGSSGGGKAPMSYDAMLNAVTDDGARERTLEVREPGGSSVKISTGAGNGSVPASTREREEVSDPRHNGGGDGSVADFRSRLGAGTLPSVAHDEVLLSSKDTDGNDALRRIGDTTREPTISEVEGENDRFDPAMVLEQLNSNPFVVK